MFIFFLSLHYILPWKNLSLSDDPVLSFCLEPREREETKVCQQYRIKLTVLSVFQVLCYRWHQCSPKSYNINKNNCEPLYQSGSYLQCKCLWLVGTTAACGDSGWAVLCGMTHTERGPFFPSSPPFLLFFFANPAPIPTAPISTSIREKQTSSAQ